MMVSKPEPRAHNESHLNVEGVPPVNGVIDEPEAQRAPIRVTELSKELLGRHRQRTAWHRHEAHYQRRCHRYIITEK
jgi:hypothetical protein